MRHQNPPKRDEPTDDRATRTTGRDRGVSEIIGAILLFGLLIAVLVLIQTNAVPDANKKLEFQHNERVQGDFVDLDADLEATAATGNGRATVVETGLRYPPRFFLFNPPPVAGAARTGVSEFTIQKAVAQGNTETADYWDGGAADPNRFVYESRSLRYDPAYNVYADAPVTTYTHGAVVNQFGDSTVRPVDDAAFVNGRTISLIALDGDRDASQVEPLSLEAVPLSTNTRTVRVTDDGSPIVIRIQTDLSATTWGDLLADEFTSEGGNVLGVDPGPGDTVDVRLQQGVTYELRLAKLGVGAGADEPAPAYLTSDMPTDLTTDVGGSRPITVEVRDAFNGPQAGVPVTFTRISGDGSEQSWTVETDDEGRATIQISPDPASDIEVVATAELNDPANVGPEEQVVFTVSPRGSGDDNTLNPIGSDSVLRFEKATVVQGPGQNAPDYLNIEFDNTGDTPIQVSAMRINFYFTGSPGTGSSQPNPPDTAIVRAPSSIEEESLDIRGPFTSFGPNPNDYWTIDTTDDTLTLEFFEDSDPTDGDVGSTYVIDETDFLVLTVEYPDGRVSSYIIAPEDA